MDQWTISPPSLPDRRSPPPKRFAKFSGNSRHRRGHPQQGSRNIAFPCCEAIPGEVWVWNPQKACPQRFGGSKTKFTGYLDRVRWRWNYSNVSSPQEDLYTHKWLMRMGRMIFICIFCWSKQCISMRTSTQKPWKWWDLVQRNFRFQRLGDLGCPSMLVYWGQRQNVKIKLPQAINSTSSAYVIQI